MRLFDMRNDPGEPQPLPDLLSRCESFQRNTLGNVDWAVFKQLEGAEEGRGGASAIPRSRLQLRAHFFRTSGTGTGCAGTPSSHRRPTRTAASQVPGAHLELGDLWNAPPEFCGDDVYAEMGSLTCRCP